MHKNQQKLMDLLFQTTSKIVQEANSKVLYRQSKLSNLDEVGLTLLNAKGKMEIENYALDEEKEYLKRLSRILFGLRKSFKNSLAKTNILSTVSFLEIIAKNEMTSSVNELMVGRFLSIVKNLRHISGSLLR